MRSESGFGKVGVEVEVGKLKRGVDRPLRTSDSVRSCWSVADSVEARVVRVLELAELVERFTLLPDGTGQTGISQWVTRTTATLRRPP